MAVCHIPLARLRAEGAGLAADLVRREAPLLCLIDAVTEEDLSLAAGIGQALDTPPVYCGSAALAEALPVRGEQPDVPCRQAAKRVLVVTGSQKKETAAQVRRLEAVCGLHKVLLDSARLLHEPAPEEISRAAQRLTELLRQEDGAILAFAPRLDLRMTMSPHGRWARAWQPSWVRCWGVSITRCMMD